MGDHLPITKEQLLLRDAQATVAAFESDLQALGGLAWRADWLDNRSSMLELMGKQKCQFSASVFADSETVRGKLLVLGQGAKSAANRLREPEPDRVDFARALSLRRRARLPQPGVLRR